MYGGNGQMGPEGGVEAEERDPDEGACREWMGPVRG